MLALHIHTHVHMRMHIHILQVHISWTAPGRHQSIIWTNAGNLLFGPLGTNFSEILIEIRIFSSNKLHLKMSGKLAAILSRLQCATYSLGCNGQKLLLHQSRLIFHDRCFQRHEKFYLMMTSHRIWNHSNTGVFIFYDIYRLYAIYA